VQAGVGRGEVPRARAPRHEMPMRSPTLRRGYSEPCTPPAAHKNSLLSSRPLTQTTQSHPSAPPHPHPIPSLGAAAFLRLRAPEVLHAIGFYTDDDTSTSARFHRHDE